MLTAHVNGMTKVLTTALAVRGHTRPLQDGTVALRGATLQFEDVPVIIKAFRRMVRAQEFDVAELAMTTYLCSRRYGKPFTAIPVFPMRAFHHGAILYNTTSGIRSPKDLEGMRVGVNRGYTVTTGLWARGILQHEYGVDLQKITWVLSGDEHVAEYQPPANVVSIGAGPSMEEQLVSGAIPAAIGVTVDSPVVRPLIPNAKDAGLEMLRTKGIYPINHTVVVRNDVLAAQPTLARDLFEVFAEAKRVYVDRLRHQGPADAGDQLFTQVMEMTGDPLPYGVEPNRKALETIVQYSVEQGILERPVAIEELFAAGTERLTG